MYQKVASRPGPQRGGYIWERTLRPDGLQARLSPSSIQVVAPIDIDLSVPLSSIYLLEFLKSSFDPHPGRRVYQAGEEAARLREAERLKPPARASVAVQSGICYNQQNSVYHRLLTR